MMIDQNKIILMAKMAQYEAKDKEKDKRITDYFIEDYIYINNFKTRVSITFLTLLVMLLGTLRKVLEDIVIPSSIEQLISIYIAPYILPWVIAIVGYTLLSTIVYKKRYEQANQRMKKYEDYEMQLQQYDTAYQNEGEQDET